MDHHPGVTVDVLREVAKKAGVSLDLQRMPWKRCILLLQKNQIDGAFEVSYKPCLLYTSPSPRDQRGSRMPSSA